MKTIRNFILMLFVITIVISGCDSEYSQTKKISVEREIPKYKLGDVIYIKPDSTKCVVIYIQYGLRDMLEYEVKFYSKCEINEMFVKSYEIYEK